MFEGRLKAISERFNNLIGPEIEKLNRQLERSKLKIEFNEKIKL